MPTESPQHRTDEVVAPMSAMFPVRAPGPGDVLPNAEAGLGSRYRAGMDVTVYMAAQMSDGTDPELVSTAAWLRSRYAKPKTIFPQWRSDRDHGEVPGTNRYYTNKPDFITAFDITGLDHIGHVGSRQLTPIMNGGIFPSEFRSGPPANFNELYRQFRFTEAPLPEDVMIEICMLDVLPSHKMSFKTGTATAIRSRPTTQTSSRCGRSLATTVSAGPNATPARPSRWTRAASISPATC